MERKPNGVRSAYWFSLPRGSRIATMKKDGEATLDAIEAELQRMEMAMTLSLSEGLYKRG